ncbi:MAG: hypothetical protein ACJ71U_23245 [Terriglobales bacterium]
MPRSYDRKKYEPLRKYLVALPPATNETTLLFSQVAQIIGDTLPPSATTYREWWSNQEGGSRAPHWRSAGFKVDHVDLQRQIVRFKRMTSMKELPRALTLQAVVTEVNERAQGSPFGGLPEWRKAHKGMKILPGTPFYSGLKKEERDYVFHVGGLSELQFNLGFEDVHGVTTFRHGVAFSLQTTRELPTISPLIPKIARFNEYLHVYPEVFTGLEMWNWSDGGRSDNYPVAPIPDSQVNEQTFIFIGRLQPANAIHIGMILDDFNRLLPLYEFVEGAATFPAQAPQSQRKGFVWSPGNKARVTATAFERSAQTVDKLLRHNQIQPALFDYLKSMYGDCVSGEQPTADGTYIDVAVCQSGEYTYYEIKTGLSAQSCIREALGQLLEYSFWPGAQSAIRLVIIGEPPLDKRAKAYLESLRRQFSLPVEYRQFDMNSSLLV